MGETIVYQGEEFLSNVCLHAFAKRWVVHVHRMLFRTWSVLVSDCLQGIKFEGVVVPACVQ